jgi:hypothetical protein
VHVLRWAGFHLLQAVGNEIEKARSTGIVQQGQRLSERVTQSVRLIGIDATTYQNPAGRMWVILPFRY